MGIMETKIEWDCGKLANKVYQVTMEDGSVWHIPIIIIAMNHAKYYASADEISFEESLKNTTAMFLDDDYEIEDWARSNMNWEDVVTTAIMFKSPPESDHQEGWVNGDAEIITL
jgi:hypothetical protein